MRGREVVAVIAAVLGVFLLFGLLGGGLMLGPGMMGYGYGYGYGLFPWLGIGAVLFRTLLVVAGIVLLLGLLRQGRPARIEHAPREARPIDIVRERYARGEITKDQFDQMRRDLEER